MDTPPAEAAVVGLRPTGSTRGAQHDAHPRPSLQQALDQPGQERLPVLCAVDLGCPQTGGLR